VIQIKAKTPNNKGIGRFIHNRAARHLRINKKGEGRFVKKWEFVSNGWRYLRSSNTSFCIMCSYDLRASNAEKPMNYLDLPPMTIDKSKQYTATIETEKGKLVLELYANDVPITVNNFVFLAREGFYNNTTFHRVIDGFMAQGGDPTGTGMGGPGYSFADEFTEHTHVTGALSMANGGPNTNGSQFFITYSPQHHLDGMHSVFGQLIEGTDVLEAIEQGDTILRVTIEEK
jgi:peptidyl-prolyl cis-trans isomerase B (cyclophilin B)